MKLSELMDNLDTQLDSSEYDDYEVKVKQPYSPQEGTYSIEGVRWDHQNHEVILELGDD